MWLTGTEGGCDSRGTKEDGVIDGWMTFGCDWRANDMPSSLGSWLLNSNNQI
jgi:hypothetical protein